MFRLTAILLIGLCPVSLLWGEAAPAVRIGVEREGPCLLATDVLAAGFNLSKEAVVDVLESRGFALSCQGLPGAYGVATKGLVFFGKANGSVDSAETVYLLENGTGLPLAAEGHASDDVDAAGSPVSLIPFTQHLESNTFSTIQLESRVGDGWMCWVSLRPFSSYKYVCPMPGFGDTDTTVRFRIALRSYYPESDDDVHRFGMKWNDRDLGTAT
jgi:hypothetical protein